MTGEKFFSNYLLPGKCPCIWQYFHGRVPSGCLSHATGWCSAPPGSRALVTSPPPTRLFYPPGGHNDTAPPYQSGPAWAQWEKQKLLWQPWVRSSSIFCVGPDFEFLGENTLWIPSIPSIHCIYFLICGKWSMLFGNPCPKVMNNTRGRIL